MTKEEALKLLELIRLAYPYAYRDLDEYHKLATVRMWLSSFPGTPYPLIEECFNRYRMENRYAPTVADINHELRAIRTEAETAMYLHRQLGNRELEAHFRRRMEGASPMPGPFSPALGAAKSPESDGFRGYGITHRS